MSESQFNLLLADLQRWRQARESAQRAIAAGALASRDAMFTKSYCRNYQTGFVKIRQLAKLAKSRVFIRAKAVPKAMRKRASLLNKSFLLWVSK